MSGRVRGTKRSDQNILAPDPKRLAPEAAEAAEAVEGAEVEVGHQ